MTWNLELLNHMWYISEYETNAIHSLWKFVLVLWKANKISGHVITMRMDTKSSLSTILCPWHWKPLASIAVDGCTLVATNAFINRIVSVVIRETSFDEAQSPIFYTWCGHLQNAQIYVNITVQVLPFYLRRLSQILPQLDFLIMLLTTE